MSIEPFPNRIVLELTPQCNLSCQMCPRHYVDATPGFMEERLFRKLIDEIRAENPKAIVLPFWRGESCLHPNFHELLGYALEQDVRIHLSTNGYFTDPMFIDLFYRCEFITYSIHSRRGYDNARKFIVNKPPWSSVTVQISFVDSEKSTAKYLARCIADHALLGFDSVRLYVEHTIGGEYGKSIQSPSSSRFFCPKLNHTLVVSFDGGYSRCNHIWEPEPTPNLHFVSIREVWEGECMAGIRASYPDVKCGPCDQWSGHTNGEAWLKDGGDKVRHVLFGNGRQADEMR